MIDTICILYEGEAVVPDDYTTEVLKTVKNGVVKYEGNVRNMYFAITDGELFLSGSIAKYLHGHNIVSVLPSEIQNFLNEMESIFRVSNIGRSRIMRADYGHNVKLETQVSDSIHVLSSIPRHNRSLIQMHGGYGLYFSNGMRQLVFYDKYKESPEYQDVNEEVQDRLLKYEVRLKAHVKRQLRSLFGVDEPRLVHMVSEAGMRKLNESWYNWYMSIKKLSSLGISLDQSVRIKTNDVWNMIIAKAIYEEKGVIDPEKFLNEMKNDNAITQNQKNYMMRKIRRISQEYMVDIQQKDVGILLDKSIYESYALYGTQLQCGE